MPDKSGACKAQAAQGEGDGVTTVAVRDGVLAADMQTRRYEMRASESKIFRFPEWIIAGAGSVVDVHKLVDWFVNGGDLPKFTLYGDEKPDAALLAINAAGEVWYADHWGQKKMISEPFWAIGSGAQAAMGAMHRSCDAATAVFIASKVDIHTNSNVETAGFPKGGT